MINQVFKYIYPTFKTLAFMNDAERVHNITIQSMRAIGPLLPDRKDEFDFQVLAFGLHFKSPFGLAAGLDKNAEAIDFLTTLPFSFIEIGTVTPLPQAGNDLPRLFRYPKEESLRNRMGFNNHGSKKVLESLLKANKRKKIIGVNLGKNKSTSNEKAHEDYAELYKVLAPNADYIVINVSSPNTPGLRDLLSETGLRTIFEVIQLERKKHDRPVFVKVSPDMSPDELSSVVDLVKEFSLTGIIATNTTIMKDYGEGGMSGKILYAKARATRQFLLNKLKDNPTIELIGVGGFSSFSEIKDYWIQGGKLVQIYSAFIFQGPSLLFELESELIKEYKKYNVTNFNDYLESIRNYK